ncbi:2OG-Fe(II) oxygenase [Micromonospora sp. BL4]|uniref:2OG-Fe(II) oxygenase n=1 Tax=Micromonospora sp. BL4 TaxID=2478710 RepID=UPI000EF61B74|nr:2OG-Fe(II) oxygenase [Micromonospora sp. BL4]RLP88206.1 2OG-Fe(II) oxygenase [Micromonospora sp. BL4]
MSDQLRRRDRLTAESLRELASGEIDVIWHREYYPPEQCDAALPRVVRAVDEANFLLTKEFTSVGTSMGEVANGGDSVQRYLDTAADTTRLIRHDVFAEQQSPTDLIRLDLDEMWPYGATVGRHDGRMMLPGVLRRMTPGGRGRPHIDRRQIPLLDAYRLHRRLGVNIYLEVPEPGAGGEIDFWGTLSEEEFVALKADPFDYGIEPERVGPPLDTVLPGKGDLVMFEAGRMHGVREVRAGCRTSAACFIGVRAETDPLLIFA